MHEKRFRHSPRQYLRLRQGEMHQARLSELRQSIEARYAEQLAKAGRLKGIYLQGRMAHEYRRQAQSLGPSPYAL